VEFIRTPIASLGLAFALFLPVSLTLAQPTTGQPAARSWSSDPRVQSRTYVFTNTGEALPYAVFVSTKVAKDTPAPLIVALRGYGGNPGSFMWDPALNLAEAGGYIMVAPMGYTSGGNFGNPPVNMAAFGRRGGAATNVPGLPAPMTATNPPPGDTTGGVDLAKASEYSEQDVMNVLAIVLQEFNINDHRIYLMGHSQGGAGALHIADKYSSIWAAVAGLSPGAPGYQLDANAKFKDVAILIMAGDKDGFIGSVHRLDERMKSLNIPHEYLELPGLDHGSIVTGGMTNVFQFFGQHIKP
jgi:predicted esterase